MTSQSPRKRLTTAPRTTRLRTAAKLAAAALLFGGPASAQQPGLPFGQTPAPFNRPAPNPAAGGWVAAGRLPSNPANPPPNYTLRATPRPPGSSPSAGGRVLYFQKAAGALVPTPNPDTEPTGLAMAGGPGDADTGPVNPAIPDVRPAGPAVVPVSPPRTLPPIPDRPIAPSPRVDPTAPGYVPPPLPAYGPQGYRTGLQSPAPQPRETTSQKPRQDLPKGQLEDDPKRRAEMTRLPPRTVIFNMYDDVELEKLIVKAVQDDIIRLQTQGDRDKDKKEPEKRPMPPEAQRLEFPSLAEIRNRLSPPGVPYVAKTASYAPNRILYEPVYVIHRRLHFEEKNAERYGWDLGFIQPFVSTLYFYKDALLWPNSLASGIETGFWDTSAGKCLPGSPVPYLLYPPGLTISGMLFEGGIITGTAFILGPVGAAPVVGAAAAGR